MQKVGFFTVVPLALIFLINTCRWLIYELWPVVKRTLLVTAQGAPRAVTGPIADQRREEARLLYSGAFVVSILACIIFLGVSAFSSDAIANWNNRQVMYANVAYITFELTLSVLAMRTVKFEMVQSLYALIEAKKTYVRYISHELRTVRRAVVLDTIHIDSKHINSHTAHRAPHPLTLLLTNPPSITFLPTAHEHRLPRA